jgi:hypothetical protein
VLADTEAEVAGLGEVALAELVFLDLETTLEDLLGLGATDGDVDGDLFVTADTEGTDSVAGLACCAIPSRQPSDSLFSIYRRIPLVYSFRSFSSEDSGVLTVNRSLTAQLLEHLSSTGKSVTRLADRDVEHELLNAQLAHGVGALVLSVRLHWR